MTGPAVGRAAGTSALRRPLRDVPGWTWVAVTLALVLVAVGPRYGFHRDELYFVQAGQHPALGYPDQPALVPCSRPAGTRWSAGRWPGSGSSPPSAAPWWWAWRR